MPDEVNLLRKFSNSENLNRKNIHRVVPEQITGGVVYLQSKGGYVRKQGHHLVYFTEEEGETKVPLEQISQIVVFGPIQLTTQAISLLLDLDIPTVFLSAKGRFKGALFPAPTRNSNLRHLQYLTFDNPEIKLLLSKEIVKAKILNTRTLYMRSLRNQEPEDESETESPDGVAISLKQLSESVERANSLDTLLGLEGSAARTYFSNFSNLLRSGTKELGFSFEHRNRRPPVDPVNALLSLAYSLLAKECFSATLTVGFDPYFGFYHGQRSGRPSLALDLMEEFRTVLADSVVLTLLNKQMLSLDDFIRWGQACYLSETGRKKFFSLWETRKNTEVTHPVFSHKVCYSRVIEMQARMLAAFIKKDIPFYKAFTWR
jgi:CRISPR-associated protein Cas1